VKYFKDVNDKKHELAILDKQIQYNQTAASRSLEEIHISRDIQEQASLYATYKTEITWVDAVNGLVRPILAYSFFIMYMVVKYLQYTAISRTSHIIEYIEIIWSTDDQAIFAGIISFYYGQRTFQKLWKNKI
jgi:hypothetical protein